MLWVDTEPITVAELNQIDSEVTAFSAIGVENLTLTGAAGLIRRGRDDIGRIIKSRLLLDDITTRQGSLTTRDVSFTGSLSGNLAQVVLSGLSLDEWSALKQYTAAGILRVIYRAAANQSTKDRYTARLERMESDISKVYWPAVKMEGIPVVLNPLPAPGAFLERAGEFSDANSNVTLITDGAGTVSVDYDFSVTWVGDGYTSGAVKNNEESFHSERVTVTMVSGKVARVNITGLTPPDGDQPEWTKHNSSYTPGNADRWNVWAGVKGGVLFRQTLTPIVVGTDFFQLPADPLLSGEQVDLGQVADLSVEVRNRLIRS